MARWTPSIVPKDADDDDDVYLVVDDFGRNGRCYREIDVEDTDRETVIKDLLEGQYKNPVRVVAFNIAEKVVAGRFGRHGARVAAAMRRADARRAIRFGRVHGPARGPVSRRATTTAAAVGLRPFPCCV